MYYTALYNTKYAATLCMGDLMGHIVGRLRLAGQSQCEKCPLVTLIAVTILLLKHEDPCALLRSIFLNISAVSGRIFLKPNLFPLVK